MVGRMSCPGRENKIFKIILILDLIVMMNKLRGLHVPTKLSLH